jgi:hypothetical protein
LKTNLQRIVLTASIAVSFLVGCSTSKRITDRTDPSRPSDVQVKEGYDTLGRKWEVFRREESALVTYAGTITDIDYATREMTLKGPDGRLETFVVDKKVQRFEEARIGDKVSVDYYLGIDAEVRPPTAEEKANPLKVLDTAEARNGPNAAPSAYDMRRVRALVTIASVDKSAQTVTVKGSNGRYYTSRVKDPSRLDKVRIGDSILMTFTEATVVSLKPTVMTRSESLLLNYTGTITDLDYPNREMTLKSSDGQVATFYVDRTVQRFNEAKVGDKVSMTYYLGVSAEVRKPTAEEKQNPLVVLDTSTIAGPDAAPGAYETRKIRAVVTIESMDKSAQTVTVKGPRGKYFTTRVADPSRFERVRIGDNILMTFTEATAVSLKPATE